MSAQEDRADRVRARITAAVSGCRAEWTDSDDNTHMCLLIGLTPHSHMCSCGAIYDDPADDEDQDQEPELEYDPGPEVDDEGGMSEYRHHEPEPWS